MFDNKFKDIKEDSGIKNIEDEIFEDEDDENEDDELEKYEEEEEEKPKKVVWYESEYEDVKANPNKIWMKYDIRIRKTLKIMAYWKSFDMEELYQQAYIYFVDLCEIYIPYYKGNFIPFDKFLFKNLIIKLRAYIQNYYLKSKREQPTELSEKTLSGGSKNDISDMDNSMFVQYLYSLISERQAEILTLTFKGYKQQEIGQMLDISQSRVSVIKKRTLAKLQKLLEESGFER